MTNQSTPVPRRPVVSSAHLAGAGAPELSEVEFGLTLAVTAYQRWMVRCMSAAGMPRLSPTEILILHTVRHRERAKRMMDISLVLDIEEVHLVTYAVRKLEQAHLVVTRKVGKEKLVEISPSGIALCDRYGEIRQELLVAAARSAGPDAARLSEVAVTLRTLSGFYTQAARAAATL